MVAAAAQNSVRDQRCPHRPVPRAPPPRGSRGLSKGPERENARRSLSRSRRQRGSPERGKKRIMLLGLPLLQLLTISQFRAILAHEFGHYYAGDTRMGPWVFRARMNMAQVLTRLGRDSVVLSFLSRWAVVAILRLIILGGLSLWWKLFNRITQHVSRKQEYRCDELACYLAGSESLEKGLCSTILAAPPEAAS